MQIHIKRSDERLCDIAEGYGISEKALRMINEIEDGEPCVGEELLILTPTRTYTVQNGDTPERIALRFGIRVSDIFMMNPWADRTLKVGDRLALKYDERAFGMAMANGYCYKGCERKKLICAMPYLTYITFAGAVADERGVRRSSDFKEEISLALKEKKTPLLRVFDRYPERYKREKDLTPFAEALIEAAQADGYKGIVLDSCSLLGSAEEFGSFLMILRKLMIGCDLILITEINEKSPLEFSDFADGSVMYYPKYAMENAPSFDEGERSVMADFACRGESAKAFIDMPSLARSGAEFCTVSEALKKARRCGASVKKNENTLLCHVGNGKQGEYTFTSLEGIKKLLGLVNEFDYMGVCFDIMRTPLSHIMMYNSMFKTSYLFSDTYNIRTREGCSRGVEE